MKGSLLIVSGPSGAGKSSLIKKILEIVPNSIFSLSSTTREIRRGEKDGVNYCYVTKEEFLKDIEDDEFLEWAKVHENYYGTPLKPIFKFIKEGKLVILDIDVQGFMIAKQKFPQLITSVFVTTKTQKELKDRLVNRDTDSQETIYKRLNSAVSEMTFMKEYKYLVINDDFETALKEFLAIVLSATSKTDMIDVEKFIIDWANV